MVRVATGDHDAFEELYLHLAPGVYGLALCVAGSHAGAEDITRDVFGTLWMRAPTFDPARGTVNTWAMTLTHRLAVGVVQHDRAPNITATAALAAPPGEHPSAELDPRLGDVRLGDLRLGGATDQQRLAIALVYFGGFAPSEVALRLGLPEPTVTTQLRDGLRRLAASSARTA